MNRRMVVAASLAMSGMLLGCRRDAALPRLPSSGRPPGSVRHASDSELAAAHVDESGVVPILEYHDVLPAEGSMKRSIAHFRHDLDRLYASGYRPILLSEYLDNRVGVPLGKSPVILTFDDARQSQFRFVKDGTLDPECAVGILQEFARMHPDFPVRATFYILPQSAFGPAKYAAKKLKALLDMGCELGNHTISHPSLRKKTDAEVQQELAGCVKLIHAMAPNAKIDTVALPLGIFPKNRALLARGSADGQSYANRAVLKVGAGPAPGPANVSCKPMSLPRIIAAEGPYGITFWLDKIDTGRPARYVSDGDPATVTVPAGNADKIAKGGLHGAMLRTYAAP